MLPDLKRRCINWPYLHPQDAPFCRRWNCPLPRHGWPMRLKAFHRHLALLTPGDSYYVLPVLANQRLHGRYVGPLFAAINRVSQRLFPEAHLSALVHVSHATHYGASPVPHLHLLLHSPQRLTDDQREHAVRDFTKTVIRKAPRAAVMAWEEVRCISAHLRYLYRAQKDQKELPLDRLPHSGDRYQQAYRLPRSSAIIPQSA